MSNNVLIFGAGVSVSAGIPVLSNFIEKMMEFGQKGMNGKQSLSHEDREIFEKAIGVRKKLNEYHGRASFDDRNLEDILSILSFNAMSGKREDKENLNAMINGIGKTIELTCSVKHSGKLNELQSDGPDLYRTFWRRIIKKFNFKDNLPTIITFNYDLVLERSLLQVLINTTFDGTRDDIRSILPYDGLIIKYQNELINNPIYAIEDAEYRVSVYGGDGRYAYGKMLSDNENFEAKCPLSIDLLKLHGSLNFPTKKNNNKISLTRPVENPYILPPVFNKSFPDSGQKTWKAALDALRNAKNVIIVGYSLPITDIYMQYFFKAGIGPNTDLNKIIVFDPVLFRDDDSCEAMKKRYGNCFSEQIRKYIDFRPSNPNANEIFSKRNYYGTFQHFVNLIEDDENYLFFR